MEAWLTGCLNYFDHVSVFLKVMLTDELKTSEPLLFSVANNGRRRSRSFSFLSEKKNPLQILPLMSMSGLRVCRCELWSMR